MLGTIYLVNPRCGDTVATVPPPHTLELLPVSMLKVTKESSQFSSKSPSTCVHIVAETLAASLPPLNKYRKVCQQTF